MEAVDKIKKYMKNLYIRYTLVNELYMVDVWEQVVIHIVIFLAFSLFWYFNYQIITNGLSQARVQTSTSQHIESM